MASKAKRKYPRAAAIAVAQEIVHHLKILCEQGFLKVAGSLRRGKQQVGDVEIVYVPRREEVPDGLFDTRAVYPAEDFIEHLLAVGVLSKRLNSIGNETWGPKNKLAVHVKSGIPVDFFRTTKVNFWNYLVCRTGGERTNIRIASAAKQKRLRWNPYDGGFTDLRTHEKILCASEEDVFAVAGLDYLPPHLRA